MDPENLMFARGRLRQVREVVPRTSEAIRALDEQYAEIYRHQPFSDPPDLVQTLRRLVESRELSGATDLP